jgi:Putative Actinobacterial Holin-X, holin superfamily III
MALDVGEPAEEPSLGELVAAASRDLSTLIRGEIDLAKAEIGAEVSKVAAGAGAFGGAAFFAVFAFLLMSFAFAYGLAKAGLPLWASFLIAGGSYLLLAGVLGLVGLVALKKVGPPERTIRTAKDTAVTLKNRGKAPARSGI